MAPGGGGKRKRGDRTYSQDSLGDGSRPSPHRPGNLSLAQHNHQGQHQGQYQGQQNQFYNRDGYNRGGRRGSRGGGRGQPRSPLDSPNTSYSQQRGYGSNNQPAMSPPAPPQPRTETPRDVEAKPPTPVSSVPTQTPPENSTASLYVYNYVMDSAIDSWKESGRTSVVNAGIQAQTEDDVLALGCIFQELLRAGLDGRLEATEAGSVVNMILSAEIAFDQESSLACADAASYFLDCVSLLAEEEFKQPSLRATLFATGISAATMREVLDMEALLNLGLVRSTFKQKSIRSQTNMLYRQSNYNLLREETEGYSKLLTELFTTSGNEPPSAEVVSGTFERVKAMVGTFDLDVGRVLDITLDVFAAVLVKHYRFFVKFLRVSSWWPEQPELEGPEVASFGLRRLPKWALPENHGLKALSDDEKSAVAKSRYLRDTAFWERVKEIGTNAYFELGGRRADPEVIESFTSFASDDQDVLDPTREWVETTGTLPPPGNKVAAQILGFKLRFYSSSARDAHDTLPSNLVYLAALLIKIGFISLKDLYSHLWPADEDMEGVKVQKMKEKAEKERLSRPGGGAMNALMTAGALSDDTLPSSAANRVKEAEAARAAAKAETTDQDKAPAEGVDELPEPSDQKVQLLKSLLTIGAIPESLYMLGRFPWLLDAFPDLPEHIHRILHHSISKIYEPLQPVKDHTAFREPCTIVDPDQSGVAKGALRRIDQPPRKVLRWAQIDKMDTTEGTDYRFYLEDWVDNVPVCQSVDDVFLLCNTFLNLSGLKIGQDPLLLSKLTRIGVHSLREDGSEGNKQRWIDLLKRLLVPALSLTKHNPGTVGEVWTLLKQFPVITRYNIYSEWYTGQISRLDDIKSAFDQSRAETKDILKRISKTNTKQMARALAKIATSSPGVVFAVAIGQIESYDNLVEVIVECGRYFTDLAYDVLTWSLMNALGARGRNRVQADGMLTSKWLSALSLFAGKIFKRYSIMNPTPILQYVAGQLRNGNSTDLIVLEQITSSMAGIVSDNSFNEYQVIGMAGGPLLQSQMMQQLLDRRHEPGMVTTSKRLMKALVVPRLAGQLLISIAQERQTCVYKVPEPDAHLKLLGNLFDQIHRVLTQYLDLLRSNLSPKDFSNLVPSLSELIGEFGLEPSVAFWISRPSITAEVVEYDKSAALEKDQSSQSESKVSGIPKVQDVEMSDKAPAEDSTTTTQNEPVDVEVQKTEGADVVMEDATKSEQLPSTSSSDSPPGQAEPTFPWHPVLRNVMESVRPTVPDDTWEVLSESFYLTFWQLSLGDMLVPTQTYEKENVKLRNKSAALASDRSDVSHTGLRLKEQNKKLLADLQDRLTTECKEQIHLYSNTRKRLAKEKDHWFAACKGKSHALSVALLQHCFIPRIMISPVDSLYTFKILKHLHSTGAKNFRTVRVFDELFNTKRMTSIFFLCTAREAENVGRFYNEVIKDLGRWHADKALFEREAHGANKDLLGFRQNDTDKTLIEYEAFRNILQKWHMNFHTTLKVCFTGGEYMHIRNAIITLKAVALNYPVINWMGQNQVSMITELSKAESREDLKLAAMSLLGNLKRREKEWVLPQAFSLNKASRNGTSVPKATPAKGNTPQLEATSASKLNAMAPEFVPTPQSIVDVNGSSKGSGADNKVEVEDGEINSPVTATKPSNSSNPFASSSTAASADKAATTAELLIQDGSKETSKISNRSTPRGSTVEKTSALEIKPGDLPPRPELKTPTSLPAVPPRPLRPESTRTPSDSSAGGRLSHSLPNRPEPPSNLSRASDQRLNDRQGDRNLREPRENRFHDYRRGDRPSDFSREQMQDRQGFYRGYDRPTERPSILDRDKNEANWGGDRSFPRTGSGEDRFATHPRDGRPLLREDNRLDRSGRDRQHGDLLDNNRTELADPRQKDTSMHPPRSAIAPHSDRTGSIQSSADFERSTQHDRRGDPSRYDNHSHPGSQRGSRAGSPNRRDERSVRGDHHHRDDRSAGDMRRPHEEPYPRSRYDDSRLPSGPRTDRPYESGYNDQSERFRDSFKGASTSNSDSHHGRPSSDAAMRPRQQESQYGRLNPDPPSGPRLSNGNNVPSPRSTRSSAASQPQITTQVTPAGSTLPSPSTERHAPTGPALGRSTRSSTGYSRPHPGSTSAPQTPSTESTDTSAVHPDRLKAIQTPVTTQAPDLPRASQMPSTTPSGPRAPSNGELPSPGVPSRAGVFPPQNQNFQGNERGRGDKRFAGLNNMLQQAGAPNGPDRSNQGTSVRGRSTRGNESTTPAANTMSRREPPQSQEQAPPPRQDLFAGRPPSNLPPPQNSDEMGIDRGGGRSTDRRPPRRRDGRSASPRRASGPPPPAGMGSYPKDDRRQFRGPEEPRDLRPRNPMGPPPPERDNRRNLREEGPPMNVSKGRERRDGDRRDDWGGERMGMDRRDRRDTGVMDADAKGRKRPRAPEDSYDQGKRSRRGL